MWQRVAEDYAPFDLDVTTEYPGSEDFLVRASPADQAYGIRVLVSPIGAVIKPGAGGVSYVGVFSEVGASLLCVSVYPCSGISASGPGRAFSSLCPANNS